MLEKILETKFWKKKIGKQFWKKTEKNVHARNVAILTKLGGNNFDFSFVLVVLPKMKLWTG